MKIFYNENKEYEKVQKLSALISWSHNILIFNKIRDEEINNLSRSKNLTSMQIKEIKGRRVHNPYAFTENGIYMLMTILKGELIIK